MAGRLSAALAPLKHLREAASRAAVQPPFIGEPRSGSETLDTGFLRCYPKWASLQIAPDGDGVKGFRPAARLSNERRLRRRP